MINTMEHSLVDATASVLGDLRSVSVQRRVQGPSPLLKSLSYAVRGSQMS